MRALIAAGLAALAIGLTGARADKPAAPAPIGAWGVEDIGGAGVLDQTEPALVILADGRVNGSGGCNRFSGTATLENDMVTFGTLAMTRMACAAAVMEQEQAFLTALESVSRWREDATGRLELLDSNGETLMLLTRGTDA